MGIGIDAGSFAIKVVRLRRKAGKVCATGVTRAVVGYSGGNGETRAKAIGALRKVAADAGDTRGTIGGITGRDVNLRFSHLPPVGLDRLDIMMEYEVMQIAGKSGGSVYSGYCGLDIPDKPFPEVPMLIGLGKNTYVDEKYDLFEKAGITPKDLCPNSIGLFHAFRLSGQGEEGKNSLILDVGAENVDLVIASGTGMDARLVFARNLSQGAKAFTDAVRASLGGSQAEAERWKMKARLGRTPDEEPKGEAARLALLNAAGHFQTVVNTSLQFARQQTKIPDLDVARVYLSGGGARVTGFAEYLVQTMSRPVEMLRPFDGVDLSGLDEAAQKAAADLPTDLSVALGLALLAETPGAQGLSLLPEPVRKRRDFLRKDMFLYASIPVLLAGLVVLFMAGTANKLAEKAALEKAQKEQAEVNGAVARYEALLAERDELREKDGRLADEVGPGSFFLSVLARARSVKPERIWVSHAALEPASRDKDTGERVAVLKGFVEEADTEAHAIFDRFRKAMGEGSGMSVKTNAEKISDDKARLEFEITVSRPAPPKAE